MSEKLDINDEFLLEVSSYYLEFDDLAEKFLNKGNYKIEDFEKNYLEIKNNEPALFSVGFFQDYYPRNLIEFFEKEIASMKEKDF